MKIGIVNDLPLAVEALRRAVALAPQHRVIWVAQTGAEAVDLCARTAPDLVLMDLIMPGMDGVEATRRIMAATPCAILVVTADVSAQTSRVFEAMGHGALDAVDVPTLGGQGEPQTAGRLLAKIEVIARLLGKNRDARRPLPSAGKPAAAVDGGLVVIGASAGGPGALATILGGLPESFPAAIVIVQHVDQQFALGMAQWLGLNSKVPVDIARPGASPAAGTALLASTNDHLIFSGPNRLDYTSKPAEAIHRPSIDVFFHSVLQFWPGPVVGVVLTGMGRDGAAGLKALREYGHFTIAQDKATSSVYGMPKAAAAVGAAAEILSLDEIAPTLARHFNRAS